jgi:DNA-binding NarL/FixJ family response regulator
MRINNVHVLAVGRRVSQLLIADRSEVESAIAVRAIKRLSPQLEIRSVSSLTEAENELARQPLATVFVASGLDDWSHGETISWFARSAPDTVVIALLECCDDRARQEALEAGASSICSKPDLLVAQLRREAAERRPDGAMQLALHVAKDPAVTPRRLGAGQVPFSTIDEGHHR